MMKKVIISVVILLLVVSVMAQKNQETGLKREVTLYNPYKPSLPDVIKKSYLPDMTDTSGIKPEFKYNVRTYPFMPSYTVTPVKPAALLPDPLPKLYNSYINLGFGTYITPLAEISISSQRSKKGAIGLYARHFSTNGNVELQNSKKTFAGYMDNDASVYGKKFLKGAVLNGSLDFIQRTRYAYGYDTAFTDYDPSKKEIKLNYYDAGGRLGLASSRLDSSSFSYNFNLGYNFFSSGATFYQHSFGLTGDMAKKWKGFYAGARLDFNYYRPSDSISLDSRYIAFVNPYLKKSTKEWNLKLGLTALLDRNFSDVAKFHIYPDVQFGFNIIPDFMRFFADLSGRMENNYNPLNVIDANPYLIPEKTLYNIKNTNYALIVKAGFKGETGIDGNYSLSASYSVVNDMLFFSNYELTDNMAVKQRGNYFIPLPDDANILNVHGDMSGRIANNLFFETGANYYSFTLTTNQYPWNKPSWDAVFKIKYNLRNKIIAGAGLNALGKRKLLVTKEHLNPTVNDSDIIDMPSAFSFNLSAEYRYTKILSFWIKLNNINFSKYYEWAYFPTQRFIFMAGFTYSL
jgi:hypothetical protein